jgi:hypothetical protein
MTTDSAVRHQYLDWLILQIGDETVNDIHPVCTQMHQKEFVWFIANDDNRLQDGLDLRLEFLYEMGLDVPSEALRLLHVSVLEVLVAMAKRIDFQNSMGVDHAAWMLMQHLGLDKYRGRLTPRDRREVDDILERLIWRHYEPDGEGSFFPLAWPERDMRRCEIWYQMMAWLNEQTEL